MKVIKNKKRFLRTFRAIINFLRSIKKGLIDRKKLMMTKVRRDTRLFFYKKPSEGPSSKSFLIMMPKLKVFSSKSFLKSFLNFAKV